MISILDLRDKVQITQVVGKYVSLKRKGSNYLGVCPFHKEKTPSFTVNERMGIFKCFGCGKSGDMFDFVSAFDKTTFKEAVVKVAAMEGLEVEFGGDTFVPPTPLQVTYVPKDLVAASMDQYERNVLFQALSRKLGAENVLKAFIDYYVGTARNGATIFWQVDQFRQIRTGSKILYKEDAHRDRSTPPVRLFKQEDGYSSCLFGAHLLFEAETVDVVAIVESEKTALVCSILMPELNGNKVWWLACSSSNGMTDEKMRCLQGLNILLVPDFSWLSRAIWGSTPMRRKLNEKGHLQAHPDGEIQEDYKSVKTRLQKLGCAVQILDFATDLNDGTDVADLLLEGNMIEHEFEYAPAFEEPDYDSLLLIEDIQTNAPPVLEAADLYTYTGNSAVPFRLEEISTERIKVSGVADLQLAEAVENFLSQENVKLLINRLNLHEGEILPWDGSTDSPAQSQSLPVLPQGLGLQQGLWEDGD